MTKTVDRPVTLPPMSSGQAQFRGVHRLTDDPIGRALKGMPDWVAAVVALAELGKTQPTGSAHVDIPGALAGYLADELLAGREMPADLATEAARMRADLAAQADVTSAVELARRVLTDRLDEVVRDNVAVICEALHAELDEVVTDARAMPRPGDLVTAESAIAADRVGDWTRWTSLLDRHAALRRDQGILYDRLAIEGDTGNHDQARADYYLRDADAVAADPDIPMWPTRDNGRLSTGVAGSPAFLRWAVRHDVALWVPTPDQLDALQAQRFAASPISYRGGRHGAAARPIRRVS